MITGNAHSATPSSSSVSSTSPSSSSTSTSSSSSSSSSSVCSASSATSSSSSSSPLIKDSNPTTCIEDEVSVNINRNEEYKEEIIARQKYKRKYLYLKKYIMALIYENSALCDQITYLQDKILYTKEENNFFANRLRNIEMIAVANTVAAGSGGVVVGKNGELSQTVFLAPGRDHTVLRQIQAIPQPTTAALNRTHESPSPIKRKTPATLTTVAEERTTPAPKSRKRSNPTPAAARRRNAKSNLLRELEEARSRVVFPLVLQEDLVIFSLGQIVTDRLAFHTEDTIYPVGYLSTKIYGHVRDVRIKCSYSCKIIDDGLEPRFEIRSSDSSSIFVGSTPDECHRKLLMMINERSVRKIVDDRVSRGADFFGLTNPTVHYLISSCEGASKCIKYNFKKFAEKMVASKEAVLQTNETDACVNHSALLKSLPVRCYENDRDRCRVSFAINKERLSNRID